MKIGLFLIIIFEFSTLLSHAQTKYNLPPEKFYPSATIGMLNYEKIKVKKLTIENDSVYYTLGSERSKKAIDNINYIRVKVRNAAKQGAIIGGATMLGLSLVSVANVSTDPNYKLKKNAGITILLLTAGGTVFGALIGSGIQKNKSYYVHVSEI